MYPNSYQVQRRVRRAYRVGRSAALSSRAAAIKTIRRGLGQLNILKLFGLVLEPFLQNQTEDIIRAGSILIGALVVVIRRLDPVYRAAFIGQINTELDRLTPVSGESAIHAAIDNGSQPMETRH